MTHKPRIAVPALALALAASVSGCASSPDAPEEFVPAPGATEPSPGPTLNAVEDDTTLIVRAAATAADGARFDLELHVHAPRPWDDIANQTLPRAAIDDCGGELTEETFRAGAWSFTRLNVSSIPVEPAALWPDAASIVVLPADGDVVAAGRGMLRQDLSAGPTCRTEKVVTGVGNGGIAVGIAGDATALGAWTGLAYGFGAAEGLELSDCSFELTPLGRSAIDAGAWQQTADAATCSVRAS